MNPVKSSLAIVLTTMFALSASAVNPIDVYQFDTPEQQERYKGLIEEFRCPKCLNTNLAGSDAPIAQDMRRMVHELVVREGYTDQEVRDYLRDRYGDFVLYDPPFEPRTYAIWLVPAGVALLGLAVILALATRARKPAPAGLGAEERARVQALLQED